MILYRICTEDIARTFIEDSVSARFPGYTIITSIGYWHGRREYGLVVEILGENHHRLAIHDIAHNIKLVNKQESILVQEIQTDSVFL